MRFTQPRSRDPNELRLGPQRRDIAYPAISHSAPQPADHLIDHVGDGPTIRDTSFDALRDQLLERDLAFLEVAVRRPLPIADRLPIPRITLNRRPSSRNDS